MKSSSVVVVDRAGTREALQKQQEASGNPEHIEALLSQPQAVQSR